MHSNRVFLVALLMAAIGMSVFTDGVAAKKPNILFIFADDQAYDTIGAQGNSVIKTPALDRLSKEGNERSLYSRGTEAFQQT